MDAAPWLLAGFFIAGLIHAWIPVSKIARHLGRPSLGGVLKASLLGIPLPLCSCSVIPVASSMRRGGASRGATAAFLISTPETGVDSISITYALLGPVMAILRPLAALISAMTAGLLINRFAGESTVDAMAGTSAHEGGRDAVEPCGCNCACAAPAAPMDSSVAATGVPRSPQRMLVALRYGFVEMFADLAFWLALGFVLAGLISAALPAGFLEGRIGSGLLAKLIVLIIGLPLYVCATSSTPIAAALMAKGMSPGTALVFLLAGPATNAATILVIGRELGRRSLGLYLGSIAVVAMAVGSAVDALLVLPTVRALYAVGDHDANSAWAQVAGAVLLALMLNGLRLYRRCE